MQPCDPRRSRWLASRENSTSPHPTIGGFPQTGESRMVAAIGEKRHYLADLTRTRRRLADGLGDCRRHSIDAARAGGLERLPAIAIRYRRLPGAVVRGLPRSQPIHRLWPLSAFR